MCFDIVKNWSIPSRYVHAPEIAIQNFLNDFFISRVESVCMSNQLADNLIFGLIEISTRKHASSIGEVFVLTQEGTKKGLEIAKYYKTMVKNFLKDKNLIPPQYKSWYSFEKVYIHQGGEDISIERTADDLACVPLKPQDEDQEDGLEKKTLSDNQILNYLKAYNEELKRRKVAGRPQALEFFNYPSYVVAVSPMAIVNPENNVMYPLGNIYLHLAFSEPCSDKEKQRKDVFSLLQHLWSVWFRAFGYHIAEDINKISPSSEEHDPRSEFLPLSEYFTKWIDLRRWSHFYLEKEENRANLYNYANHYLSIIGCEGSTVYIEDTKNPNLFGNSGTTIVNTTKIHVPDETKKRIVFEYNSQEDFDGGSISFLRTALRSVFRLIDITKKIELEDFKFEPPTCRKKNDQWKSANVDENEILYLFVGRLIFILLHIVLDLPLNLVAYVIIYDKDILPKSIKEQFLYTYYIGFTTSKKKGKYKDGNFGGRDLRDHYLKYLSVFEKKFLENCERKLDMQNV